MKTAPRIIGVSGYAQVGKSTFAKALVECEGYVEHSFAQPIKDMLYALNPSIRYEIASPTYYGSLRGIVETVGWEQAKKHWPEVRRLLQALGTDAGRGLLGDDVWVDMAIRRVHEAWAVSDEDYNVLRPHIVFADVRFPNEAEAIRARGGIIVNIERPGVEALNDHASENSMEDIEFDYVIHNDGTIPELRQKAMDLIAKERGVYAWKDARLQPSKSTAKADGQKGVYVWPDAKTWPFGNVHVVVLPADPFDVARKFTPDRYQGTEL